jgi:hypothetical protein
MSTASRLQLKRASGWFAAGAEVETALRLLSDSAFKLFVWLCLHVERGCGSMAVTALELAQVMRKSEAEIQATIQELWQTQTCIRRTDGIIEISDRFWPYRRTQEMVAAADDRRVYIHRVKRCFLERSCVRSVFTAADEKLAAQLHRDGIPIVEVERAILLGSVRKYIALLNNGGGTPITTLHYFTALFIEVRQEVSEQYWGYVARKVFTLEQRFGHSPGPSSVAVAKAETK